MLCDYGSCHVCEMEPEKLGYQQCEDEIKRFTTLDYRSPYDIWVRRGRGRGYEGVLLLGAEASYYVSCVCVCVCVCVCWWYDRQ